MIKIKPEMWRDLPALAKYMELELKLSDGAVYVDKSDSVPTLLQALPPNLSVAEFFVDYADKIIYTYHKSEERNRYARIWLQDATKWTPEILEQLNSERLRKFVHALGLPFLVGMAPLESAREYLALKSATLERHRAETDWRKSQESRWSEYHILDTLVAFMRRRDITQEERDACAIQWSEAGVWSLNSPPMITSAMYNLGVSTAAVRTFLEKMLYNATSSAAKDRWNAEIRRLDKEAKKEGSVCE